MTEMQKAVRIAGNHVGFGGVACGKAMAADTIGHPARDRQSCKSHQPQSLSRRGRL